MMFLWHSKAGGREEKIIKRIKLYLLLHLLMLLFSMAPICIKLAGQQPFFSWPFLFLYGASIVILGVYALVWQQIIKNMPLSAAYANRAITVVWGMVWGMLIFQEEISLQKFIGALVIVAGIVLYAFTQGTKEGTND